MNTDKENNIELDMNELDEVTGGGAKRVVTGSRFGRLFTDNSADNSNSNPTSVKNNRPHILRS